VLLFSVESEFSKKGLIRRRIESNFGDHGRAGFDPSGLQRDVIDMPNTNGRIIKYSCVTQRQDDRKCGSTTAV